MEVQVNANLPEEVRESDFVVHPESAAGDMNSNVVGLHVDLDQVEVVFHDQDTLNFVGFQTVEDIIKFYNLTTKKTRRTTSKAIFEGFSPATYDTKSLSNSFTTEHKRLPYWILAIKNILCMDEKLRLKVNNKTNKNEINEIEIKLINNDCHHDEIFLTIHVYLTTALIQCRGLNFNDFEKEIFPKIKKLVDQSVLQVPLIPQPSTPLTHSVASTEQLSSEPLNASANDSNSLPAKPDIRSGTADFPSLETSIVNLCQSFGKLNLESLLNQILDTQRTLSSKVIQMDEKLDKMDKDHIQHTQNIIKDNTPSSDSALTSSLSNIENFLKLVPPDLKQEITSRENQIELLIEEVKKKDNDLIALRKEKDRDIQKAIAKAVERYEQKLASLKIKLEESEREKHLLIEDNKNLVEKIADFESNVVI